MRQFLPLIAALALLVPAVAHADDPDFSAFAETWYHHGMSLTVYPDGTATIDNFFGGGDRITRIRFTRLRAQTASGQVIASQEPQRYAPGKPLDFTLIGGDIAILYDGYWTPVCGTNALAYWDSWDIFSLCGA